MKRLALLGLLAVLPIFAQQPAQQAAQPPKSIIADVHPSSTPHMFAADFGGVLSEGRYAIRDATMLKLIKEAYDVNQDDIAGGPGWMSYDIFDVIFKVPAGTTPSTVRPILQSVLADRFGLVVHHDTRPMPRWVLTVGEGGPKLKASNGSGESGCKRLQGPGMGGPITPGSFPNFKVACHNLTSAAIAENLSPLARDYLNPNIDSDHQIIDATKLQGSWDFDLEWSLRGAPGANHITIFEAVSQQLGLKLSERNFPEPVLVVDKVNRRPTDNPPAVAKMLAIPPPRFEVASVKPADPSKRQFMGILYTGGSQVHAGGTLRFLIGLAYQIPFRSENDLVVGLPKSADSQRWDILAKLPSTGEGAPNTAAGGRPRPPALSVAAEMLRGVLLDQFELKAHTENREVAVWALTLRSGPPKMKRADDSERTGCNADFTAPTPPGNIGHMMRCTNESMAQLVENLQQMAGSSFDHPLVDATGLKGGWDFLLGWTPTSQYQRLAPPSPGQPAGSPIASDPSVPGDVPIFDAVERQIGLKLVKEKRSIPVIVVDHVDEQPIE